MPASAPRQPDLLAWPQLREAEQRLEAANAARLVAQRRYHLSPVGLRLQRLAALQEAANEALRAACDLDQLRRALS